MRPTWRLGAAGEAGAEAPTGEVVDREGTALGLVEGTATGAATGAVDVAVG